MDSFLQMARTSRAGRHLAECGRQRSPATSRNAVFGCTVRCELCIAGARRLFPDLHEPSSRCALQISGPAPVTTQCGRPAREAAADLRNVFDTGILQLVFPSGSSRAELSGIVSRAFLKNPAPRRPLRFGLSYCVDLTLRCHVSYTDARFRTPNPLRDCALRPDHAVTKRTEARRRLAAIGRAACGRRRCQHRRRVARNVGCGRPVISLRLVRAAAPAPRALCSMAAPAPRRHSARDLVGSQR